MSTGSLFVREILRDLVAELRRDPELARGLRRALFGDELSSEQPLAEFESISNFAKRIDCSRRHVFDLKSRGLVKVVGSGRAVRVDVQRSLLALRNHAQFGAGDSVERAARAAARRAVTRSAT